MTISDKALAEWEQLLAAGDWPDVPAYAMLSAVKELRHRRDQPNRRCDTCAHWVSKIDAAGARFLHDWPDGWRLCALTVSEFPHDDPGTALAVAVETDMALGVLATAPAFGCVQWEKS
jgi:hypothetical protein